MLLFGTASGMIFANYSINGSAMADFTLISFPGGTSITEGTSTTPIGGCASHGCSLMFSLPFPYVAGMPVRLGANINGFADTPGSENMQLSLALLGFTDQNGAPVAFAIVPEPPTWRLVFVTLASIIILGVRDWSRWLLRFAPTPRKNAVAADVR
jgi:hypothetical protein